MNYQQRTHVVDVPQGAGTAAFLRALEGVLRLPMVQSINVDITGRVTATHYVPVDGTDLELPTFTFDDLTPYAVARNGQIVEVLPAEYGAAGAGILFLLFRLLAAARLHPTGWVVPSGGAFRSWVQNHVIGHLGDDPSSLLGVPVYADTSDSLGENVVLLGGCPVRGAPFSDTTYTLKVSLL